MQYSEAEVGHVIQSEAGVSKNGERAHRSCHLHFSRQLPASVFLQTSSPTEEFHRGIYKSADVLLAAATQLGS